jgi:glycerol dehydrogenase
MLSAISFPGRYVQGYEAVNSLGAEISRLGDMGFLISSPTVFNSILPPVNIHISSKTKLITDVFAGECCDVEIKRLAGLAKKTRCNVIIGMGGGKTLDTAKAVARELNSPVIIVPTIASSDAPCTALSVIHTQQGKFEKLMVHPRNPDVVIVDTRIIVQSPVRFLVAGMGDALSSIFEGDSCRDKHTASPAGFLGTMTVYELCHLTYDVLLEYGLLARKACEAKLVIPAVEHIIEANTLLSGLCHESGGAAAAHAINNGFTVLKQAHGALHGEKVGYGTLASLFLTDKPAETIDAVYSFCQTVGLPTTLSDLGLKNISDEELGKVAQAACAEGESIHSESTPISIKSVLDAIKAADSEGKHRKSE